MLIWIMVAFGWLAIALLAFMVFRLVAYADSKFRPSQKRRAEAIVIERPGRRGRAA
jgi:type IV secretory pathway TrbD component